VVANAVYDRDPDRRRIEGEAGSRDVAFLGVWLDASPGILRQRVGARVGGASDANVEVLAAQLERGADPAAWRKVDATPGPEQIVAEILGA
jgi:predicted kinase